MKVQYVHVQLVPCDSRLCDNFVFAEGNLGVDDLHIITRDGFVTVNHLASDGARLGKTWPASAIHVITTRL